MRGTGPALLSTGDAAVREARGWLRRRTIGLASAAVMGVALVAGGCDRVSPVSPGAPEVRAAKVKSPQTVFFTKVPAANPANQHITPAADVHLLDFDLVTNQTKGLALSQLRILVAGSLQVGDVINFRLIYYPKGRSSPGVVVATNDASTWVAPGSLTPLALQIGTPIDLTQNFKGSFSFVADVVGTAPFFVWSQLQTASVMDAGVERLVTPTETCDLPLTGDTFWVNQ